MSQGVALSQGGCHWTSWEEECAYFMEFAGLVCKKREWTALGVEAPPGRNKAPAPRPQPYPPLSLALLIVSTNRWRNKSSSQGEVSRTIKKAAAGSAWDFHKSRKPL